MEERKSAKQMTAIFREALQTFIGKVRQDEQVIAAVLMGSLSYDQVWEKSDIDLKLIVHDQKLKIGYASFVEQDVPINTSIQTRNEFKRWMERSVQSSIHHSMLIRSTLLFTKDPSIADYFEQIRHVGERDRQLQLIRLGSYALSLLAKAEKWLYVKRDATYSAFWVIKMADVLAQMEVVLQGDVPMREAVQQALEYNPELFQAVYAEMIGGAVGERQVNDRINRIRRYLNERAQRLFQPILDYLKEEADVRTVTDIAEKFSAVMEIDAGAVVTACDWLAERELLAKVETETKATPKSRIALKEPAYFYEMTGDPGWEM